MNRIVKIFIAVIVTALSCIGAQARDFVLVIDAGHGGKDVGARGVKTNEKSINLAVALALGERIKKECKDVKVVYTRRDDSYLSLKERSDIANDAGGDLFISIHVNSLPKKSKVRKTYHGAEVYTLGLHKSEENLEVAMRENAVIELESDYKEKYSGFDPSKDESYIIFEMAQKRNLGESIRVAGDAQNELVNSSGRANRGVRQAGFWVLWATSMPSVLVELDFISNPTQETYLASKAGQKKLADALYDAFIEYKKYNAPVDNGMNKKK